MRLIGSFEMNSIMRWAMLWLFGAFWGLSALELFVIADERGSYVITPFVLLTLMFGGLAGAAWRARKEGVGLLAWLEELPDWLPRSAQLAGLVLLVAALVSGWGMGKEDFGDAALFVGLGLGSLAMVCKVRPLVGRRRA